MTSPLHCRSPLRDFLSQKRTPDAPPVSLVPMEKGGLGRDRCGESHNLVAFFASFPGRSMGRSMCQPVTSRPRSLHSVPPFPREANKDGLVGSLPSAARRRKHLFLALGLVSDWSVEVGLRRGRGHCGQQTAGGVWLYQDRFRSCLLFFFLAVLKPHCPSPNASPFSDRQRPPTVWCFAAMTSHRPCQGASDCPVTCPRSAVFAIGSHLTTGDGAAGAGSVSGQLPAAPYPRNLSLDGRPAGAGHVAPSQSDQPAHGEQQQDHAAHGALASAAPLAPAGTPSLERLLSSPGSSSVGGGGRWRSPGCFATPSRAASGFCRALRPCARDLAAWDLPAWDGRSRLPGRHWRRRHGNSAVRPARGIGGYQA